MSDEQDSERVAKPRADERTLRLVELAWTLWHEPAAAASTSAASLGAEPGDETTAIRSVIAAIREARR